MMSTAMPLPPGMQQPSFSGPSSAQMAPAHPVSSGETDELAAVKAELAAFKAKERERELDAMRAREEEKERDLQEKQQEALKAIARELEMDEAVLNRNAEELKKQKEQE